MSNNNEFDDFNIQEILSAHGNACYFNVKTETLRVYQEWINLDTGKPEGEWIDAPKNGHDLKTFLGY